MFPSALPLNFITKILDIEFLKNLNFFNTTHSPHIHILIRCNSTGYIDNEIDLITTDCGCLTQLL